MNLINNCNDYEFLITYQDTDECDLSMHYVEIDQVVIREFPLQ